MSSISLKTITTKSGQTVTIRSAQPDDAAQLIAYVRSVLAESPNFLLEPDEFNFTEEQERQWVQDHLDDPGKLVVLAEVSGTVIGCLSFETSPRRRIAHRGSFGISVRGQWRGQGIGTAMLKALLDWAEANPLIDKVGLSVFANNLDAIRLYERLGFVEEGRQPLEIKLGPGEYADNILMYRLVGGNPPAVTANGKAQPAECRHASLPSGAFGGLLRTPAARYKIAVSRDVDAQKAGLRRNRSEIVDIMSTVADSIRAEMA